MSEIIISYLVLNGVSYMYTATYIFNTVMFYSEIQNKLSYIWLSQKPSKKNIKHTIKYVNTTSEVIGNSYTIYKTGSLSNKKKDKQKINNNKKNISDNNINNNMGRRLNFFISLYDLFIVSREQKREKRRLKLKDKMDKYRKKLDDEKDAAEEAKMKGFGYHRCKFCKHYTAPDKMLESIASSAIKFANESKKYTPLEIEELPKLILNIGKRKPQEHDSFDKYISIINKITVKCANCDAIYSSAQCVDCGVPMFSVSNIIELQQKQIDLIYENRAIIEFECDCSK